MKICITIEEFYQPTLEKLYKLGYKWPLEPSGEYHKYLCVKNGRITYFSDEEKYTRSPETEISYKELCKMTEKITMTIGPAIELLFAYKAITIINNEIYEDRYIEYSFTHPNYLVKSKYNNALLGSIVCLSKFKDFQFKEYIIKPKEIEMHTYVKEIEMHTYVKPVEAHDGQHIYSVHKWYKSKEEYFSVNSSCRVMEWEEKSMPLNFEDWPKHD